jgi:hypothetical protein
MNGERAWTAGELREQLDAYIAHREQQHHAPATLDLDRRKVEAFLSWLEAQP